MLRSTHRHANSARMNRGDRIEEIRDERLHSDAEFAELPIHDGRVQPLIQRQIAFAEQSQGLSEIPAARVQQAFTLGLDHIALLKHARRSSTSKALTMPTAEVISGGSTEARDGSGPTGREDCLGNHNRIS